MTKVATKPEFLVAKEKMLVALATVSVAISCPQWGFRLSTTQATKGRSVQKKLGSFEYLY